MIAFFLQSIKICIDEFLSEVGVDYAKIAAVLWVPRKNSLKIESGFGFKTEQLSWQSGC